MLSVEIVVESRRLGPTSITRLDVDLTEEQIVSQVRAVANKSAGTKDAIFGLFQLVSKMPGGTNVAEIGGEPLIGADCTVVAEYNGSAWEFRVYQPSYL